MLLMNSAINYVTPDMKNVSHSNIWSSPLASGSTDRFGFVNDQLV